MSDIDDLLNVPEHPIPVDVIVRCNDKDYRVGGADLLHSKYKEQMADLFQSLTDDFMRRAGLEPL